MCHDFDRNRKDDSKASERDEGASTSTQTVLVTIFVQYCNFILLLNKISFKIFFLIVRNFFLF